MYRTHRGIARTINRQEGISVRAAGPGAGAIAKDSYMVGGQANTLSTSAPITGEEITEFIQANKEALTPADRYLGAWLDKNRKPEAQVDLDVAKAYPRTDEGGIAARTETLEKGERAYGEVGPKGEYVATRNNPFTPQLFTRSPEDTGYLDMPRVRERGAHFRAGINSEALAILMEGGPDHRERALHSWVTTRPLD